MAKWRSSFNFSTQYASNKQGFAIGIENFVFLKVESVAGTFVAPGIGTQGKIVGAAAASDDVSAGSNVLLKAAVDGEAAVTGTVVIVGASTPTLICSAAETALNTALAAAGQDGRVWASFTGAGASLTYTISSQKPGTGSSVTISAAASLDIAADLKLDSGSSPVATAGTFTEDFLWATKFSAKFEQPFEPSAHKVGRQAADIILSKKKVEGDLETYVCFSETAASAVVDTPVQLLLEQIMGVKDTAEVGVLKFNAKNGPTKYFTAVQGNNIFSRVVTGCYVKNCKVTLPGDAPAKFTFSFKGRDAKEAGIARIEAVATSSVHSVVAGEGLRFDVGSKVMHVSSDGRTVLLGADGSLGIAIAASGSVTCTQSFTVASGDFIVGWLPHVFGFAGQNTPVVGLEGSVSFDSGSSTVEQIRNVEFTFDPKVEDQDNWFGADGNRGYIVGDKAEITLKADMLLSASEWSKIIAAKSQSSYGMKIVLGDGTGRRFEITAPKFIPKSPAVELPDSGSVLASFEGPCLQSAIGENDAFEVAYR
jgi:hypothetical protein